MKRRIFILVLALLVAFSMMPGLGFAATKIVPKKATTYSKWGSSWEQEGTKTYKYDSKGREIKMTNKYLDWDDIDDDTEEPNTATEVTKTTYTKKGNVKTVILDVDSWRFKDVYVYKSGKLVKINHYYKNTYNNTKYKKENVKTYTYKKSQIIIKSYAPNYKKTSDWGTKTTETYNSKGLLTKSEEVTKRMSIYYDGSVEKEKNYKDYTTITYKYDKYNRLIKETKKTKSLYSDGTKAGSSTKHVTEYKYSGYYKKRIYPKRTFVYYDAASKPGLKIVTEYMSKKVG